MVTFVETGLKPLSANESYLGQKIKSKAYRMYENHLLRVLPDIPLEPKGKLKLVAEVYYSNKLSDLDNALKPFIDCLQKRYKFNDNRIYKLEVEKFIVPKGEENIRFRLEPYTQPEDEQPNVSHTRDDGEHRCPECGAEV